MVRCFQLASLGAGAVSPNPMVGAVLVFEGRIIGEGYHKIYGGPHAEVNCLNSVSAADKNLIALSTLYVSLEPCAHFGKTPPCAGLIIREKIQKVMVATRDPFSQVDGRGIEKLKNAGVEVNMGILKQQAIHQNRRFFCLHQHKRPYIILKWAQTADGFLGSTKERLLISGTEANRLNHRWRSEESAILIGANTAIADNPRLTTRLWPGKNPVRILVDPQLRVPAQQRLFDSESQTIVFNYLRSAEQLNSVWVKCNNQEELIPQLLKTTAEMGIMSILVEGGAETINRFLHSGHWDEARIITGVRFVGEGISAPKIRDGKHVGKQIAGNDQVNYFINRNNIFYFESESPYVFE